MTIYYLSFFVFLSVSLFVFAAYKYYAIDNKTRKVVNSRLKVLEDTVDAEEALELLREKRGLWLLAKSGRFYEVNRYLIQTGLDLDKWFIIKIVVICLFSVAACITLSNAAWYSPIIGVALTVIGAYIYIKNSRSKRILKFEAQLPDALDIIVRSLRAGHPTQTAISLAARECPDPIGTEFGLASDEIRHGLDISSALKNMSDRVGMPDLIYVEAAIAVQATTGGSLSEIVARLSLIIRERFKLRQKVATLTSEGRISGIVLTALPIGIGSVVAFTTPSYYGEVYNDPLFYKAIISSVALLVIGHLVIQKMLNFKY